VAETLKRKWMSFELSQEYVAASAFRFAESFPAANRYFDAIMRGDYIAVSPLQTSR